MTLREEYQKETEKVAIQKAEHLSIPTLPYVEWLENRVVKSKNEAIYHSLNYRDCDLKGQFVFAKDGGSNNWSLVKLVEIEKEEADYPFFCSSKETIQHFQFIKKATNIEKITLQEAIDILAEYGRYVEITTS